MNDTEKKVRELISSLFDDVHLHLVDLEIRGKSGSQVVSVFADTGQGITLDEITRLTREINDLLDMHDVIRGAYRLDVSSPGIDRPLLALWEFEKNIGRDLRVIFEEDNEQKEAAGTLISANEDEIVLKIKKDEIAIPLASIIKARVKLKW
jgi:ribosome maturation factor RimP